MSQPNTWRPMPSRNSSGTEPRFSMVRYEMHLLESSSYGPTRAWVGHASIHRVQVPQLSGAGRSGVNSNDVTITPKKSQEPIFWLIRQVFLPSHPTPAYFAYTRS